MFETPTDRMEPFPRALRLLRERRRLSQRQVAEALGVHPSVVSAWECGEGRPSLARFGQLADPSLGAAPIQATGFGFPHKSRN